MRTYADLLELMRLVAYVLPADDEVASFKRRTVISAGTFERPTLCAGCGSPWRAYVSLLHPPVAIDGALVVCSACGGLNRILNGGAVTEPGTEVHPTLLIWVDELTQAVTRASARVQAGRRVFS